MLSGSTALEESFTTQPSGQTKQTEQSLYMQRNVFAMPGINKHLNNFTSNGWVTHLKQTNKSLPIW